MHDTSMHFMIGKGYKLLLIEHLHEVGSGVTKKENEIYLCASGKDDDKSLFVKKTKHFPFSFLPSLMRSVLSGVAND